MSCLVSLPKINYLYILKSKQCLGCFCWVSQKVENSLVSQQSIALDVYFCACISCNNIVINAEILLLLGASRHIFKSHKASRDTTLILCWIGGYCLFIWQTKYDFFCQICNCDFTELSTHQLTRSKFYCPKAGYLAMIRSCWQHMQLANKANWIINESVLNTVTHSHRGIIVLSAFKLKKIQLLGYVVASSQWLISIYKFCAKKLGLNFTGGI